MEPLRNPYSLPDRIAKVKEQYESQFIQEALLRCNFNRRRTAELLQISYRSLLYKMKDYNLREWISEQQNHS